jgi:hypothetical protein
VLDSFSGFVYSPNDKTPPSHSFGGDFNQIEKSLKTGTSLLLLKVKGAKAEDWAVNLQLFLFVISQVEE